MSCGGKSQVSTSDGGGAAACDPRADYTSIEAVRLAKCSTALPGNALLLSLASNGAASLDAMGHDVLWHFGFWEPSSSELYSVNVNVLGAEITQGPYPLGCTSGLDPLDSAILVPDAVRRLGETGQVPLLMRQIVACGSSDPEARDERYVATSKQGQYTFVLYDAMGAYQATCPCAYQDPVKCGCIP